MNEDEDDDDDADEADCAGDNALEALECDSVTADWAGGAVEVEGDDRFLASRPVGM